MEEIETVLELEKNEGHTAKYSVVTMKDGNMYAFRYGSKWRDLTGDKLILALVQEIERLKTLVPEADKLDIKVK